MSIREQYERWPYPRVPLAASVRASEVYPLHLAHLAARCGLPAPPERPRLWIAGCGTWQPYVWALANPRAEILATDLSQASLDRARWHCRLHGIRHVRFQRMDLQEELPEGPFDGIECYGVLMNLADPGAALAGLASRLAPAGVLRLMVYPWFSRRRIFQVQRVARLLGLVPPRPGGPARLRAVLRALPAGHPLAHAFATYTDAATDAGLVDGFLHQGDRGFTALHLDALVERAGLVPAFWFHRPWARPEALAAALGEAPDAVLLHQADLDQELRGNLVPCLVRREAPLVEPERRVNPLLDRPAWWGRTLDARLAGGRLQVSASRWRALRAGDADPDLERQAREAGVVLGGPARRGAPARITEGWEPTASLQRGEGAANPLYDALFASWRERDPEASAARWGELAEPLEEDGAWGLTPIATGLRFLPEVRRWRERLDREELAAGFAELRYAEEDLPAIRRWLGRFDLPRARWEPAEERELWALLASWERLFLTTRG